MKLHHQSKRYEVQLWRPHTLSWKPVLHTDTAREAINEGRKIRDKKQESVRVLDRKDGVHKVRSVVEIPRPIAIKR